MPSPTRLKGKSYPSNMVDDHIRMSLNQPQSERLRWGPVYGVKVYQSGSLVRRGTPSFFTDEWWLMDRKVAELHYNGDRFLEWILFQNPSCDTSETRRESQFLNSFGCPTGMMFKRNFGCPTGMMFKRNSGVMVAHYNRGRMKFRQKDIHAFHRSAREWGVTAKDPFSINFPIIPRPVAYIPHLGLPTKTYNFYYKSNYGQLKVVVQGGVAAERDAYPYNVGTGWNIIHFADTVKVLLSHQDGSHAISNNGIFGDRHGPYYDLSAHGLEADFKPVRLKKDYRPMCGLTYRASDISDDNRSCISPAIFLGGAHPRPAEGHKACLQPLPLDVDQWSLGQRLGCMPYPQRADRSCALLHDVLKDPVPST